MFFKDIKDKKIIVGIPLVNGSSKIRIKSRQKTNEYGIPFSSRSECFNETCYVEWQIGYDVDISNTEKLKLTSMENINFKGANGKEKAFYELSEYIKIFYDWQIIRKDDLNAITRYLSNLDKTDYIDQNQELKILRQNFEPKNINGKEFYFTRVMYPLLVYKFGFHEIIAEIIIKERQYARGIQPMLYLCFPITELDNGSELINRTANKNELSKFTISENNIFIFLELLKIFGMLSSSHNHDVLKIIEVITNEN